MFATRGRTMITGLTRSGRLIFLAAYVIPSNVWHIVPARVATKLKGNIWLSPHKKGHKYERFIEAWELLKGPLGRR